MCDDSIAFCRHTVTTEGDAPPHCTHNYVGVTPSYQHTAHSPRRAHTVHTFVKTVDTSIYIYFLGYKIMTLFVCLFVCSVRPRSVGNQCRFSVAAHSVCSWLLPHYIGGDVPFARGGFTGQPRMPSYGRHGPSQGR